MKTGLLKEAASIFRSASRRPERASRPCYPFSGHALREVRPNDTTDAVLKQFQYVCDREPESFRAAPQFMLGTAAEALP